MKKGPIIAAVLGVYAVAALGVATLHFSYSNAKDARYQRAIDLGEKEAPLPDPAQPLLSAACAGKLTPGGPKSIAVYVAKMAELPPLAEDYYHVDRVLLGVSDSSFLTTANSFFEDLTVSKQSFGRSLQDSLNPADWSHNLSWAQRGSPDLQELRYLVVARYASLTNPVVADEGYVPGSGEFGARVLSFPDGQVLCSGRGSVRMPVQVSASGRGASSTGAEIEAAANARDIVPFVFIQGAVATPLADVCAAGGPELCKLMIEASGPLPP